MRTLSFKISTRWQYVASMVLILAVSGICMGIAPFLGHRVVAFILLLTVSLIAVLFDIWPVMLAAVLSAFIWNFFFIPPRFTFHVSQTEDLIFFVMYFVIALINAVLTFKIRQIEKYALQKEEKVNTLKLYDTLLHSLSHELRTPIATIISATDNLQTENSQLNDYNRKQLVGEIAKASFRLNQQVENLLNMSRLETGVIKTKMDWLDITDLVYVIVSDIEEKIGQRKVSIHINPNLPLISSDKILLEQIIYNLVMNACLYTPSDSRVRVSAAVRSSLLELIVEDNGPGFSEDEMKNIFDKFYRVSKTNTGGTGLGLSIVKGFTESLSGSVRVANAQPHGAIFTVEVPCQVSRLKTHS